MKVLVTGAEGQVGSELVSQGLTFGLHIISAGHHVLDITDQFAVERFFADCNPDIVINGAAYTAVDKAEDDQECAYAINGHGPACLASSCSMLDIPLLHISTDYIFDGRSDLPYSEEDRPDPQGVYGVSKLAGDVAVVQTLDQYLILRVAWVFGASGQNFVRTMLRLGQEHDTLRVVADQFGGPTWAGDIAATLLSIVKRYEAGESVSWGTYHYSGAPVASWYEFAQVIFAEAVKMGMLSRTPQVVPIVTAEYPTPAKRPQNSVLSCEKIKQHFGINQPDWHIGLGNILQEWQK